MPLYEYRCKECSHGFSEIKKVEERQTCECPKCGGDASSIIQAPHFDPKMGLDPAFETFGAKWAKTHQRAKY